MIVKKVILKKTLSNGLVAEIALVRTSDGYGVALFYAGKHIPGPNEPRPMEQCRGDVTHWLGGKPSIGLTASETEKINEVLITERSALDYE